MNNPIDDHFRAHLADVEVKPRKDLFAEKIAPRIAQRKGAYMQPIIWRVAAAVLVLLAAWPVMRLVNTPETEAVLPEKEQPVAIEQPQTHPKKVMPILVHESEIVAETPVKVSRQNPAPKGNGRLVSTTPAGNAPKELDQTAKEETETIQMAEVNLQQEVAPKAYKVKLKIDPAKYATTEASQEVAQEEEKTSFAEYASAQFSNIKEGDGLQAPPKEWFELPKIGVRVEGNPLKKVLPGKE